MSFRTLEKLDPQIGLLLVQQVGSRHVCNTSTQLLICLVCRQEARTLLEAANGSW